MKIPRESDSVHKMQNRTEMGRVDITIGDPFQKKLSTANEGYERKSEMAAG